MLETYFADMHIHIGRDIFDKPVKITGAKTLTVTNILKESSRNKGINMIGIIDCQSPNVQLEIKQLIEKKQACELPDGGIRFEEVTLILGSEIEVYDNACQGPIHVLCYFPTLENLELFSAWLTGRMKNITLSTQRYYGTAKELQYKVKELAGIFIPAHVFTPFKSLYGKGVKSSLTEVFDPDLIDGIELGLSADMGMADQIEELHRYTYLTNSDAHSLPKIAREYQEMVLEQPSFKEFQWALHHIDGRSIMKNYGMNPQLGKYYTTVCDDCSLPLTPKLDQCPSCHSNKVIKGVYDRIQELKSGAGSLNERPTYLYQVPLEYLPGLGPKTHEKLLNKFGTEMFVLHHASYEALLSVVGEKLATLICKMREGEIKIKAGGGGKYGSLLPEE
ncbi:MULTISPECIES: endonuclease Q family protein [unclassified Virgibacillus]|uniref:endonuclease Q family protein n=1 Tax=unclassified Virgibacillus TaxID=2620237 RepID=UPI0024DEC5CB|nr:endonuclease Q family protein [Virgibacillus sp. LDC-1]